MADHPTSRGDEAELSRALNHELMHDGARSTLGSSPTVIEDACAHAWAQFMRHQPDRGLDWRWWLFRSSQREAWRLERQERADRPMRTSEDERTTQFGEARSARLPGDQRL